MARIPYLSKQDVAPEYQDLLARDINLNRALVNSPEGLRAFSRLGGFIRNKSQLDPRLRELAILQVGYIARSNYEYSHHVKIGHEFGVSDDDVRAIADETAGGVSGLDSTARAVLLAARTMANGQRVDNDTFEVLRAALGNEHLTDLVITIAFYCGVVRLLDTLAIDVEDEYLHYLEEFPLPA